MNKIKFGVIACSNVAKKRFIPALLKAKNGKIEFLASRKIDKARAYAKEFGCKKYGTYEDALNDPKIDAIYLSTPTTYKKELALKSAFSNKHIIVEKPAFLKAEDYIEVLNEFKKRKLHFFENWMFKFHPQHIKYKRLIKSYSLGKVKYFTSKFTYPTPSKGDIRLDPQLQGGVFYDSIGYPLAASLMHVEKKPVSIMCSISNNKTYGVDDFVKIQLEFEDDIFADLISGFGLQYRSTYSSLCEFGEITLNRAFAINPQSKSTITVTSDKGKDEVIINEADQFKIMIEKFCQDILTNNFNYNHNSNIAQQKIIDSAYHSAFSKTIIKL